MKVEKQDTYYTVGEVAEMLRISKMTVYRMVHDCELEYAEVGRNYRILAASLYKKYPELKERLWVINASTAAMKSSRMKMRIQSPWPTKSDTTIAHSKAAKTRRTAKPYGGTSRKGAHDSDRSHLQEDRRMGMPG